MATDQVINLIDSVRLPLPMKCGDRRIIGGWAVVANDAFTRENILPKEWTTSLRLPYAYAFFAGRRHYLHRFVFAHYHAPIKDGKEVDHIDRNPLNNLPSNLRAVTHSENIANRNKQQNNTSGFVGVVWHKAAHKWMARIQVRGREVYIGLFVDAKLAAAAVNTAYLKHFPHTLPPNRIL